VTYSDGFTEILKIEELEVFMLADSARNTDILDQSIIRKDTCKLGIVREQPLALVKERSVEVAFVDQLSYVKVTTTVPTAMFSEHLESVRPDELRFELDARGERKDTQSNERPPSFPVCSHSVHKASAEPSEFFEATSFNDSNLNPQFEHVLKVKEEGLSLIATCHYEFFEEITPLVRELSAVEFSAQLFSAERSFDPNLIQLVALVLAAFNFRCSQWMAMWLFFGWDPPWTVGSKLKFAGKGVA